MVRHYPDHRESRSWGASMTIATIILVLYLIFTVYWSVIP
jgi:hypothetical protein